MGAAEPVAGEGFESAHWLRHLRHVLAAGLIAIAIARVGAVGLGGIVTNDSLGYLRRAADPFGAGFVSQGYRQAAYPVFVAFSNGAGDLLGWDHVFGVALLQRSLLIVALAATIWALRWWSIPVVAVATSESVVVHTDLLLPEGFLVPACLFAATLAAGVTVGRTTTGRSARIVLVALCVVVAACGSIKLQYGLLGALAVAAAYLVARDGLVSTRFAKLAVGGLLGFLVTLGLAQAIENRSELGVFEPVSERARAEWYGAWMAVFAIDPDNAGRPELAEYYDEGNLYTFLHGIEREEPDYQTRAAIMRDRVDSMFDAAGTSARREQFSAFVGGLGMGRLDDLRGIIDRVLASPGDPDLRISFNSVGRQDTTLVIDGYNGGFRPGIATFGPLLDPAQVVLDDHRDVKKPVAWLSVVTMLGSLIVGGRHRFFVPATLVVVVGSAAAMATGYIDNARYLLGPFAVCVIGATVAARAIVQSSGLRNVISRFR